MKQDIQPVQNSPSGTPSRGRPTGQPTGKKTTNVNPAKQPGQKASMVKDVVDMTPSEYSTFLDGARSVLSEDEYINFLDWASKERFNG
jgi:hypothetical protein